MPRRLGNTLTPRNPVARALATRRGGAHQQGRTSQRQQSRTAVQQQLEDWRDDLEFERELANNNHCREVGSGNEPTEYLN